MRERLVVLLCLACVGHGWPGKLLPARSTNSYRKDGHTVESFTAGAGMSSSALAQAERTDALGWFLLAFNPSSVSSTQFPRKYTSGATGVGRRHVHRVGLVMDDPTPLQRLMQNSKPKAETPKKGKVGLPDGELGNMVSSDLVVFFDREGCPYCRKAEDALLAKGIKFKKVPIETFTSQLNIWTGKTSAPSVWINGTYVGGCNDGTEPWHGVLPLLANGKFEQMLSGDLRIIRMDDPTRDSKPKAETPKKGKLGRPDGELGDIVSSDLVVFFELEGCPYCRKAEDALLAKGIKFKKVPIEAFTSQLKIWTGKTSAPSVWINGTYVGGCNDGTEPWHGVLPMLANGKFEQMLSGDLRIIKL